MAQNSRLVPMVCLQWVLERPYVGGSRRSPDFRFFQNEWYLEIRLLESSNLYGLNGCVIALHCRTFQNISLSYCLKVDCQLKMSGKSFYQSGRSTICCTNEIFGQDIKEEEIRPSGIVEEWSVFCMFSETTGTKAGDCFSLHVENKTITMSIHDKNVPSKSVDECIQVSQEVPRDIEALSSDISGLLEDGILPDFQLKCQNQIFQVHRTVLAARSEVFRAMFRNRMKECETGSADIKDLDVPVLEFLLKFLYSAKLDGISEDIAPKLYEAADKYAVPSLIAACSYWLTRNLTVDNCIHCLHIADSHSDSELKAAAVSFILAHPGVFSSAAWLSFLKEHLVLASEVLQTHAAASLQ